MPRDLPRDWSSVFARMPVPALLHADDVLAANGAASELLGGALEGKLLRDLVPDDALVVAGRPVRVETADVGDGLYVTLLVPVAHEEQNLLALAREDEVRRLKETSRFKTQILNTTAHELNTPLTPVRLQLHLLKTGALGALSERHEKALGIIDRNIDRLSYLVNDILDVARLESGRLDVHLKPIPLATSLEETMESFEETARRVGVGLRHASEVGLMVHADHDRLTQVLFNLVGNALKFTPEGGRVNVEAYAHDGQARIDVTDTGPGLTTEQIERLFQPFSRVHDTQQSTIAGTGLGLYICKGLMDAHGGTIAVTSAGVGQGSMFTVQLPLSDVPQPTRRPRALRRPRPDPLAERLRELI